MFELFGIGKAWEGAFRNERATERPEGPVPDSPISASGLKIHSGLESSAANKAREDFRSAAHALRTAFGTFSREAKPVYSTVWSTRGPASALVDGQAARVDPFAVDYDVLQTTSQINTQTSTVRRSAVSLGLDVSSAESASTIRSTAEMNTSSTTSYGSNSLSFSNGGNSSTSAGSLTGTYTGLNGAADATSLTVQITKGGTLSTGFLGLGSPTPIDFQVADQTGEILFTYSGSLKPGDTVYLGANIGLTLSFGAGELKTNHTASTTVSRNPVQVNTSATFNDANTSLRPSFDNNAQVTAGSFTINGTSIAVNADDSIASVIARINGAGAGVTASVSGDRVTLATAGNSEDAIVLANDTSGFLAATKLASAVTTLGSVRDDRQVLSKTSQFNTVSTGSFSVNGVSISVNTATDSLSTIISRVNNSGAGVTASYHSQTGKLIFTPVVVGATLVLDNDTSGFLAAAKVSTGAVGTALNADGAFNATGAGDPLFETGTSVQAGSFSINGVTINVAADDTVNKVLAKITASAAGVTAAYDATTELVTLTSTEGDTPITLASDTSGFLDAVKLDGSEATSVSTVIYNSFGSALGEMAEYSGVRAGSLTVNGQAIAIDPTTTTVRDLVTALNGISGVGATVNETSGGLMIWSDSAEAPLVLSDTSGVLTALGLATGSYAGVAGPPTSTTTVTGTSLVANSPDVAAKLASAATHLNDVFAGLGNEGLRDTLDATVDRLRGNGIRGLQVTDSEGRLEISVDRDTLVNSLNALADDVDLAKALAGILDDFEAGVTVAARWEAPPPTAQTLKLTDTSRAQLAADQTATSLLYLRSSLQPPAPESTKAALKAYNG